jgi:regulator of protease activity HflC (stomatin/prohibitin superfamily)
MSIVLGILIYLVIRCIVRGFYTVDPNERAVKTVFGKAQRRNDLMTGDSPLAQGLSEDERSRYNFPVVEVIPPGLHFKLPWEKIYKVSIATETIDIGFDPQRSTGDSALLDAITRDQLNIKLRGQIRYRVSEQNLYAFIFGIKLPITHVMGYFVSILREKIANFERRSGGATSLTSNLNANDVHLAETISINDLRKNLREINDIMIQECQTSAARYGIALDASLITGIESPGEVESALAAINTAYNNVSSEISIAKASADQTIVQSKRAVEIETLKVQAELEPLVALAKELKILKTKGAHVLGGFVRNVRLGLFQKSRKAIITTESHF